MSNCLVFALLLLLGGGGVCFDAWPAWARDVTRVNANDDESVVGPWGSAADGRAEDGALARCSQDTGTEAQRHWSVGQARQRSWDCASLWCRVTGRTDSQLTSPASEDVGCVESGTKRVRACVRACVQDTRSETTMRKVWPRRIIKAKGNGFDGPPRGLN